MYDMEGTLEICSLLLVLCNHSLVKWHEVGKTFWDDWLCMRVDWKEIFKYGRFRVIKNMLFFFSNYLSRLWFSSLQLFGTNLWCGQLELYWHWMSQMMGSLVCSSDLSPDEITLCYQAASWQWSCQTSMLQASRAALLESAYTEGVMVYEQILPWEMSLTDKVKCWLFAHFFCWVCIVFSNCLACLAGLWHRVFEVLHCFNIIKCFACSGTFAAVHKVRCSECVLVK